MSTLKDTLNQEGMRPQVIQDAVVVLEEEVNKKRGVSGFAIKKGFQVVKKLENGRMVEKAIDKMLNDFVDALDPYYQTYLQEDGANRPKFAAYLAEREDAVTESLLSVTDVKRQYSSNALLAKTYDTLRPAAARNVKESVPAVGRLMQKYAFSAS